MKRAEVLDTAKGYVTQDRAADHGNMEDNFKNIESFWYLWDSIKMTLLKIARIASNPNHEDNWVDGCGYLACGGELAGK